MATHTNGHTEFSHRGRHGRGRGRGRGRDFPPKDDGFLKGLIAVSESTKAAPSLAVSVDAGRETHAFFQHHRINLEQIVPVELFGLYSSASRQIVNEATRFVSSAVGSAVAHISMNLGSLLGKASRRKLVLPLLSDVLLSVQDLVSTNATIDFDPLFSPARRSQLVSFVLQSISERLSKSANSPGALALEVIDKDESLVEYYGEDNVEVWKDPNTLTIKKAVTRDCLERLLLFRQNESVHIQLLSESLTPVMLSNQGALPSCISRRVEDRYVFKESSGCLEWELKVWETRGLHQETQEEEDGSMGGVSLSFSPAFWNLLVQTGQNVPPDCRAEFEGILKVLTGLLLANAKWIAAFDSNMEETPAAAGASKFYYPNLFGDIVADTRRHYNLKKIGMAAESAIEIVRKTNNQAKRLLVDDFVATGAAVLDLACGHGQDLLKYTKKDLRLFVGVDVSNAEIREARVRYHKQGRQGNMPPCRFHVGNMLTPESYQKFLKNDGLMDVVSVQLAIHYTLGAEENANLILSSIASKLKPGGIFIGSCPSSFVLHKRMRESLKREQTDNRQMRYVFGNNVYSVAFEQDDFTQLRGAEDLDAANCSSFEELQDVPIRLPGDPTLPRHPWIQEQLCSNQLDRVPMGFGDRDGEVNHLIDDDPLLFQLSERWSLKYSFWLVDHIDAAEYIVPWRAFCRIARKYGLQCLMTSPFDEYCQSMAQKGNIDAIDFQQRISKLHTESQTATEQQEVIGFYQVFAFQKTLLGGANVGEPTSDVIDLALRPPALSAINKSQLRSARPLPSQQPPIISDHFIPHQIVQPPMSLPHEPHNTILDPPPESSFAPILYGDIDSLSAWPSLDPADRNFGLSDTSHATGAGSFTPHT